MYVYHSITLKWTGPPTVRIVYINISDIDNNNTIVYGFAIPMKYFLKANKLSCQFLVVL